MPSQKGRMPLKPTRRAHASESGEIVKECTKCALILPISHFQRNTAQRTFDGYAPYCRSCRSAERRRNYADPVRRNKYKRATENNRLHRLYGLTVDDVAEQKQQRSFRCDICGMERRGQHLQALHVDHCHRTGVFRGMLCNHCNRGLGLFFDEPARLRAAAAYLEKACATKKAA